MNQPQNSAPPHGARPQLFSAPTENAKRPADFGPSILATIDGGQARFATSRDRLPAKRILLMGALALVVAAAYVGVKFNGSHAGAAPETVAVTDAPTAATAVVKVASGPVAALAGSPVPLQTSAPVAAVAQGAAAIETVVPAAVPASAPAANQATNVAASLNNIQLALDHSEPAPASTKKVKAAAPNVQPVRGAPAANPVDKPAAAKGVREPDTDAELLAAMLPHIKRTTGAPTSPAYEKRCGQLSGEAAVDCRAKFCNGRQGVDAACPAVAPQR